MVNCIHIVLVVLRGSCGHTMEKGVVVVLGK